MQVSKIETNGIIKDEQGRGQVIVTTSEKLVYHAQLWVAKDGQMTWTKTKWHHKDFNRILGWASLQFSFLKPGN